jgi:AcrR family transcriptional regulator
MTNPATNPASNPASNPAMSGRKAQAARNDEVILESARQVFTADPGAPIAAVAQRAGVGISALYRRYPSKEALLQKLSLDTLRAYVQVAEGALAKSDPWEAFVEFMRGALNARSGAMTIRLAGAFAVTEEIMAEVPRAYQATRRLLENALKAGVVREGVEVGDISLLLEQLQAVDIGDDERNGQLRHRYLALILDGLRATTGPLPGKPPSWDEIGKRYAAQ